MSEYILYIINTAEIAVFIAFTYLIFALIFPGRKSCKFSRKSFQIRFEFEFKFAIAAIGFKLSSHDPQIHIAIPGIHITIQFKLPVRIDNLINKIQRFRR